MFLSTPLSPLTVLDAVVFAGIGFALVADMFARRRLEALDAGREGARLALYRDSLLFLWGAIAAIIVAWSVSGRPLDELGLGVPATLGFAVCTAAVVVGCAALAKQVAAVRASAELRVELARQVARDGPRVTGSLPRTKAERFMFVLVAATAGIGEEIVFRGFLMWVFAHEMPVWTAALVSTVLFTMAHLWQQSWLALAKVAVAAAIFAALVIFSGSLLPAMLLHFALDLSAGESAWAARQEIDLAASAGRRAH